MYAFTCPHCGAGVSYDLSHGAVSCEYCDSVITLDEYEAYLDRKGQYQTTELSCPQCGAVVLSYDNTISTFCSYCGSSVIFDQRVKEEQKPDGIIPFAFQKKAALNRYRERTDRVLLAPDWMREEGTKELTGIYMPFYEYQAECSARVSAKGEKRRSLGSRTEVSVYQVDGTLEADYSGSRFDAAVAFPDALSESIDTYAWTKAQPFRPSYVAGYYADGSDVSPETYDPVMARLVSDDINATDSVQQDGISLPLNGATSADQIRLSKRKVLLPVWLLTHRVKDRICYAAVNGQNGDVAADIPLDRGKFLKVSLIVAAVICTIMNFFLTIKPLPFLWVSMILTTIFGIILSNLSQQVYIRENHLDDIGRIGYQAFAEAVKNNEGRVNKPASGKSGSNILSWGVCLFIFGPLISGFAEEFLNVELPDLMLLIVPIVILVILFGVISGLVSSAASSSNPASTTYRHTKWRFSRSRAASFSVLWKIWLALAAGAIVIMSGTVEDPWYYGAGVLNILVSVWSGFDVITKQNLLASRDIPLFSMKRGGAE